MSEAVANSLNHDKLCFVAMPFGRTPEEQRWFRGWYDVVIDPAVREAEYEPFLVADEEAPNAINDAIRTHLAYDAMVVVDLGGMTVADEPNPNVMYELGIRHAFNLPVVVMAWKGQKLPFDIHNLRAITAVRDFAEIKETKDKLKSFIESAKQGTFYKPMEAVKRIATIEVAAHSRDESMRAMAEQVKNLGRVVSDLTSEVELVGNWTPSVATFDARLTGIQELNEAIVLTLFISVAPKQLNGLKFRILQPNEAQQIMLVDCTAYNVVRNSLKGCYVRLHFNEVPLGKMSDRLLEITDSRGDVKHLSLTLGNK